jgi:hypothetical protein
VLAARLRLGAMLSDLEPVVDQSYIRDVAGTIVGRQPGLRGWIAMHTPDLLPYYKTLMAYKSLADKLRMALGIEEPDTLDGVLELGKQSSKISVNEPEEREAAEDAETSREGVQLREEFAIAAKSREKEIREAYRELFKDGFPATMATLETIVRGRLGLAWMRRKRKRPAAA